MPARDERQDIGPVLDGLPNPLGELGAGFYFPLMFGDDDRWIRQVNDPPSFDGGGWDIHQVLPTSATDPNGVANLLVWVRAKP